MDQDAEVAQLLGNLVKQHGERGARPERRTDQIACGDQDSIDEVVNQVPEDIHGGELRARRPPGMVMPVKDAMLVAQELLDHEEEQHPAEDQKRRA